MQQSVVFWWKSKTIFPSKNVGIDSQPEKCLSGDSWCHINHKVTIHLRRPWTSAFFRLASGIVCFSPRLKNSGHVITFLRRCGWQNTDHVTPFWPLNYVDSQSHNFPAFVTVQRKERCPLYKILSTLAGVYAQWTTPRTCIDTQLECMLLPLQFKLYMLELRGRS